MKRLPTGVTFPQTLLEVSNQFDARIRAGNLAGYKPIPTGFHPLDEVLGGGLHAGALTLIAGPQGVGKTIFAIQAARNIARGGRAACVVCFEHDPNYLYHRLLCMESVDPQDPHPQGVTMEDIRRVVIESVEKEGSPSGLYAILKKLPKAQEGWRKLVTYWERLLIAKGHPFKTTLAVLDTYLERLREQHETVVLFVDYLQKMPLFGQPDVPDERKIAIVTEGLKNLALAHEVPIVAISALDAEGLRAEKPGVQDLWGGPTIKYEPDVAVLLQPTGEGKVTFSVGKNRMGPQYVEFDHQLHGPYYCFNPQGDALRRAELPP
ncbi:MAG TPA: hypothetical protein EYP09_07435 [Anaerolineae bacterium]|nr:hypothetical protein [Anaerolineae bacterium]